MPAQSPGRRCLPASLSSLCWMGVMILLVVTQGPHRTFPGNPNVERRLVVLARGCKGIWGNIYRLGGRRQASAHRGHSVPEVCHSLFKPA